MKGATVTHNVATHEIKVDGTSWCPHLYLATLFLLPHSLSFIADILDRGTTADDYVVLLSTMWLAKAKVRGIFTIASEWNLLLSVRNFSQKLKSYILEN